MVSTLRFESPGPIGTPWARRDRMARDGAPAEKLMAGAGLVSAYFPHPWDPVRDPASRRRGDGAGRAATPRASGRDSGIGAGRRFAGSMERGIRS